MTQSDLIIAKNFINNEWVGKNLEQTVSIRNKFHQNDIAKIVLADRDEVDLAIESSRSAFKEFSLMSSEERKKIILNIRDLMMQEKDKLVDLIIEEAGKPRDYAVMEVDRAISVMTLSAEEATRIHGENIAIDYGIGVGRVATTKKFPIGPILAFSPFNFPLNLAIHKIGPALAAGCSIVLKPSPFTPLTSLAFANICKRAQLPPGVLNVVFCSNQDAEYMVQHDAFKLFSFTGSAEIGWMLKSKAGKKRVVLELGGNAPVIVDRTANLNEALDKISLGANLFAGQICISTQRIYVDQEIFKWFSEELVQKINLIPIGDPNQSGIICGPIIDRNHLHRIHSWVQEAIAQGATLLCGGVILDENKNLYAPTLLTNTKRGMKIVDEEIFGPVAVIEPVEFFDQVIDEINASRYGLQAGLFTNQIGQMKYAHDRLQVGALIINHIPGFRVDSMPYGGVKDSGFGREGVQYAMKEMLEDRLLVY